LNKDTDLAQLSMTANSAARVLSAKPGELRHIVDSLAGTAEVLGNNSAPLARTIADLPDTLRATRTGAAALSTTLDKLIDTADDARPIAQELDPTLKGLEPVLRDLRPVAADLRPLLNDARPLLDRLAPTVDRGTDVLEGVRGKPLDRINGPILTELNREWKGYAPKYPNGGRDGAKMYQEIAYLFTGLNGTVEYYNGTAHIIGFEPTTAGPRNLKGLGPQAEALQGLLGGSLFVPNQGPHGGSPYPPLVPGTGQGFAIPTPNTPVRPPVLDPNGPLGKGPSR
jgi:phospholipid/cholesterol/gamma-HCH transport system substrate-binding protein